MKLSEAIRMNGMMKPQGFGTGSIKSLDAPCAIGGALQSVGRQIAVFLEANFREFRDEWPFVANLAHCPACKGNISREIVELVWHLNDYHCWTRSQIADWVETIEPDQSLIGELQTTEHAFAE